MSEPGIDAPAASASPQAGQPDKARVRLDPKRPLVWRAWGGRYVVPNLVVAILVLVFTLWFSAYSIRLNDAHLTHKADLGQIDQAIWNTAHGRFLQEIKDDQVSTRLTDHVEPIFIPLSLVFWVWDDVRALLVVQSLALALGALPIYLLARRRLALAGLSGLAGWGGAALAGAYLLAPPLQAAAVSEFHAFGLAPPLVAWALWSVERRQWGWFALAAILLMAVQEGLALLGALLGVYALARAWWDRQPEPLALHALEAGGKATSASRRLPGLLVGAGVALLGVVWFYVTTFVIIPHFAALAYGLNQTPYASRYGLLGDSFGDVIKSLLTRPALVARILAEPLRLRYLAGLLATSGFLALLAPEILLLSLPLLLANVLSSYPLQYAGELHYTAPLVPYLAVAGAMGLARLVSWGRRREVGRGEEAISTLTLTLSLKGRGDNVLEGREEWTPEGRGDSAPDRRSRFQRDTGQVMGSGPHNGDTGRVMGALPGDGCPAGQRVSGTQRAGILLLAGLALVLVGALGYQRAAGYTPLGNEYWLRIPGGWPEVTAHQRLLARFLAQVPAGVPGTATADLFPHVAHRELLYQFPFTGQARWALVDVTGTANRHPAEISGAVNTLLSSGWGVVDAADGYALLMRGRGSATLPDAFYDFARAGSDDQDRPETRVDVTFDGKLKLLGYRLIDDPKWRRTTVRFYWQAQAPLPADTAINVQMLAADGSAAVDTAQTPMPAMIWYPPARWRVGETVVTEGLQWYLPRSWAPVISVSAEGQPLAASGCRPAGPADDSPAGFSAGSVCLPDGRAQLAEAKSADGGPSPDNRQADVRPARFTGPDWRVALQTYTLPAQAAPGEQVAVGLRWSGWDGQAPGPAGRDYTVFLHLRDKVGQAVVRADAGPTWYTAQPTSGWPQPGQSAWSLLDVHTLPLPANLPPGRYQVVAGWYDWQSGARLSVVDSQGNVAGDEVVLGDIEVDRASARPADLACLVAASACASQ